MEENRGRPLKTLSHLGIYIPQYNPIGLSIKFRGKEIILTDIGEQMAIAIVRKLETPYILDETFVSNFLTDFCKELKVPKGKLDDFDFTNISSYLMKLKELIDNMSREARSQAIQLKKNLRDSLKEKYGYAQVDGERIQLMNWTAEPGAIFLSKGKNPLRGHWKRGITKQDITLNFHSETSKPDMGWDNIVWKPNQMWIARWPTILGRGQKYVWFSPSTNIRQEKEKAKFLLASKVTKEIKKLERYIEKELRSSDKEQRKLSTAVFLMKTLAIRVGDEKIVGEYGTVGCTTLKNVNIKLGQDGLIKQDGLVALNFIGKDYVEWHRGFTPPKQVYKNLEELLKEAGSDFIFKGLNSNKIAKFLRKCIPGLSAKVFRTYIAGITWDESSEDNLKLLQDDSSTDLRKYLFKLTNLEVAKKLNHKKALPKDYTVKVEKQKEKAEKEFTRLEEIAKSLDEKKYLKQKRKVEKETISLELLKKTAEWNLGTSLTSYISPLKVHEFCEKTGLKPEDVYSKSLRAKYSWVNDNE